MGNLATSSDDDASKPEVGVTHDGCTDDDEEEEEEDAEGMDDVWTALLRQTSRVTLQAVADLDVLQRGSHDQSPAATSSGVSNRTWNTPEPHT